MGKLSAIFGKKKFKGTGHRLGSSEPPQEKSSKAAQNGPQNAAVGTPQQRAVFQGKSHTASGPKSAPSKPTAQRQGFSTTPAPKDEPQDRLAHSQTVSSDWNPVAQAPARDAGMDEATAAAVATEELQLAIAQLESGSPDSTSVLCKVLANILRSPHEAKFRDIRLANPRIKAAIHDVEGALELLAACGFQMDAAEGSDDVHLILPMEEDLTQLKAAAYFVSKLQPQGGMEPAATVSQPAALPASQGAHAAPTPAPAPASRQPPTPAVPCDRETQVLVPPKTESGGGGVADWVFKRTPAELRAEMVSAQKKREQREMLMTKAMRDKLATSSATHHTTCLVRVRLPEGLLLQGLFNAGEKVAAIFDWLTDCMADPSMTYELIMPDRKPLVTSLGTLRSANLLPSALLMMRVERPTPAQTLTLKPEVMATMGT